MEDLPRRPWLSVLVPTYNGGQYLRQALASVAAEADPGIEIIVVDDGSTDETLSILEHAARSLPIRVEVRSHTGNWVASTNVALGLAQGRYISILHQDDQWLPGRLARMKEIIEAHPAACFLFHAAWFIDAAGWKLGTWRCSVPNSGAELPSDLVHAHLLVQNSIAMPAPMFPRRLALEVGGLDENLWYTADWDLWLKLSARGPSVYESRPLCCFRIHSRSQTARRAGEAAELRRQSETVLERYLPAWELRNPEDPGVRRRAIASAALNVFLGCGVRSKIREGARLLRLAARLHLSDVAPFFADSRVGERVASRLVGLTGVSRAPILNSSRPAMDGGSEDGTDPRAPERDSPRLTVLMPCLNEAATLATCIRKARGCLERLRIPGEVLIADNGSTDGSAEIALKEGARVVTVEEPGYGNALRGGIEAARGRWVIMGDADDSYDFTKLDPIIDKLRTGADFVMGCRLPRGGGEIHRGAMPWLHRCVGNPVLSFLGRRFFHSAINDFHCGLRGFSREAIRRLDLRTTGMEFASEMVIKATLAGLKIEEVPIALWPDGRNRPPHLRSWRDGWRHLRFMLLFSPRWLFLAPGLFLASSGALVGARLVAGPIQVGALGFDTNSLLVCAMSLIVGLQLCLFAVFTQIFAVTEGLIPPSPVYPVLFRIFKLERGVAIGLLFVLGGVALLLRATQIWTSAGFGELPRAESLRVMIPAVTLVTIGTQIVFSSFFLSILGLKRR